MEITSAGLQNYSPFRRLLPQTCSIMFHYGDNFRSIALWCSTLEVTSAALQDHAPLWSKLLKRCKITLRSGARFWQNRIWRSNGRHNKIWRMFENLIVILWYQYEYEICYYRVLIFEWNDLSLWNNLEGENEWKWSKFCGTLHFLLNCFGQIQLIILLKSTLE